MTDKGIENIKFKGKCIKDDSWVFGDLCHVMNYVAIKPFSEPYRRSLVDPSTVCLFTGMKDIEGNEVWEGDILDGQLNGEVVFTSGTFALHPIDCKEREVFAPLYYFRLRDETLDLKVIGNKFDK